MAGKNKKILIIDDDAELCGEIAGVLECEGYKADTANDPVKGVKMIAKTGYNAVILDYKMEHLTGADVLEMLKEAGIQANVIMITGRPFIEKTLAERNLAGMVKAVLGKPIDIEAMLKIIKYHK